MAGKIEKRARETANMFLSKLKSDDEITIYLQHKYYFN